MSNDFLLGALAAILTEALIGTFILLYIVTAYAGVRIRLAYDWTHNEPENPDDEDDGPTAGGADALV